MTSGLQTDRFCQPAGRTVSPETLVRRWQQGDRNARDELFERFLPLARSLARRYANSHEPFEELLQVASVGLLGALDRFDPGRGTRFAAFAIPTILGELKRHFRNTGWSLHVPRAAQDLALRVDKASEQIAARTGRAPTVQALAEFMELSLDDVLVGLDAGRAHFSTSLDAPARGEDEETVQTVADCIGGEDDRFGLVETRLSISKAMTQLPRLERQVLIMRLGGDMRQVDIGRHLGCSQMQVSRLLNRAAAHVRELTDPVCD